MLTFSSTFNILFLYFKKTDIQITFVLMKKTLQMNKGSMFRHRKIKITAFIWHGAKTNNSNFSCWLWNMHCISSKGISLRKLAANELLLPPGGTELNVQYYNTKLKLLQFFPKCHFCKILFLGKSLTRSYNTLLSTFK